METKKWIFVSFILLPLSQVFFNYKTTGYSNPFRLFVFFFPTKINTEVWEKCYIPHRDNNTVGNLSIPLIEHHFRE